MVEEDPGSIKINNEIKEYLQAEPVLINLEKSSPQVIDSPLPAKSLSPYQQCRLLLTHCGFLSPYLTNSKSVALLNKADPRIEGHLIGLDQQSGRHQMKIAVVYVGKNQENESQILSNSCGSQDYEEFLESLGWEVDLQTHAGYRGGLEKNLKTGARTRYYRNSTLEAIFHVATMMITDPSDPVQLAKKRHIGNDEVQIIWNDHFKLYDPKTIRTKVCEAHIVITPMPNFLYCIEIHNIKLPPFGPLIDKMVVTKSVLGVLVRQTAFNAFRLDRKAQASVGPFANRQRLISRLTEQCKIQSILFDEFLRMSF